MNQAFSSRYKAKENWEGHINKSGDVLGKNGANWDGTGWVHEIS